MGRHLPVPNDSRRHARHRRLQLVRVPAPEGGYASYEPYDSKLARKQAKPGHVLQLCFYADALEALEGHPPRQMHLWLGSGVVESLVVEQFGPYWRRLRRRLTDVMGATTAADGAPGPEPCVHCEFCEFSQLCETVWRSVDSLVYVAGIRESEQSAFEAADIATVASVGLSGRTNSPGVQPARRARSAPAGRAPSCLPGTSGGLSSGLPADPDRRRPGLGPRLRQPSGAGPRRRVLRPRRPSLPGRRPRVCSSCSASGTRSGTSAGYTGSVGP